MTKLWVAVVSTCVVFFTSLSLPVATTYQSTKYDDDQLPVFFFHGIAMDAASGVNFDTNLTAEGRVYHALTFCETLCSLGGIDGQVPLAIQEIQSIVAANPIAFAKGYIFLGISQGAAVARAVVEEMDDHNVKKLISLAGAQNGLFYGPQDSDLAATLTIVYNFGPEIIPVELFNFSQYSIDELEGPFQYDFFEFVLNHPELQSQMAALNLLRSPVRNDWLSGNHFLPKLNNVNVCEAGDVQCKKDQKRRKDNFLRLREAHFFASSVDEFIVPYQGALLGQYSELATSDEIVTEFETLHVLNMNETIEYQQDTYGLKTLDKRGGLFLHDVANVSHSCWRTDSPYFGSNETCLFQPVYDAYIYPLLVSKATSGEKSMSSPSCNDDK